MRALVSLALVTSLIVGCTSNPAGEVGYPSVRVAQAPAPVRGDASTPKESVIAPTTPEPNDAKTAAQAAPAKVEQTDEDAEPYDDRDPGKGVRYAGWISIGIGAFAAVIAGGTSAMMLHEDSVRDRECDASKVCSMRGTTANTRIDSLAPWNFGAWVVAGAGIGVGTLLVLTHLPRSSKERSSARTTTVGVTPSQGGVGFTLRSTF